MPHLSAVGIGCLHRWIGFACRHRRPWLASVASLLLLLLSLSWLWLPRRFHYLVIAIGLHHRLLLIISAVVIEVRRFWLASVTSSSSSSWLRLPCCRYRASSSAVAPRHRVGVDCLAVAFRPASVAHRLRGFAVLVIIGLVLVPSPFIEEVFR